MHDRPGPDPVRRNPVDGEQRSRGDLQAEFFRDFAAAAVLRRLALLEEPARQRPVIPVVRLDQQDSPGRVGEKRGRGTEHRGQRGVPRDLFGA